MCKLTDKVILDALHQGKTITLNDDLLLRELLNGSEGMIYAQYQDEKFWKPYHPNLWELTQSNWQVEK